MSKRTVLKVIKTAYVGGLIAFLGVGIFWLQWALRWETDFWTSHLAALWLPLWLAWWHYSFTLLKRYARRKV